MDDEQEAMDAAWAQQEQDERRHQEDELMARHRKLYEESKVEHAAFERASEAWHRRIRTMT